MRFARSNGSRKSGTGPDPAAASGRASPCSAVSSFRVAAAGRKPRVIGKRRSASLRPARARIQPLRPSPSTRMATQPPSGNRNATGRYGRLAGRSTAPGRPQRCSTRRRRRPLARTLCARWPWTPPVMRRPSGTDWTAPSGRAGLRGARHGWRLSSSRNPVRSVSIRRSPSIPPARASPSGRSDGRINPVDRPASGPGAWSKAGGNRPRS